MQSTNTRKHLTAEQAANIISNSITLAPFMKDNVIVREPMKIRGRDIKRRKTDKRTLARERRAQ